MLLEKVLFELDNFFYRGQLRMDTATHITMGIALGGIATLDPVVQQALHYLQLLWLVP